jgi:hypothetical protein
MVFSVSRGEASNKKPGEKMGKPGGTLSLPIGLTVVWRKTALQLSVRHKKKPGRSNPA